jgi:hypothetical protein
MGTNDICNFCILICFGFTIAGLPPGHDFQRSGADPAFSEAVPRLNLEFLLVAELHGVKGRYERRVDVSENAIFHITDQLGRVRWITAGRIKKMGDERIRLRLWLSWSIKKRLSGFAESEVVLEIGKEPMALPNHNKALVATAAIRRIEAKSGKPETEGKRKPSQ